MPSFKLVLTIAVVSLATTIALNYLGDKVPAVAKLTANG